MRASRMQRLGLAAAIAGTALAAPALTQSIPSAITFQGRLTDNSPQQLPVTGSVWMRFAIHEAAIGGIAVWQEPAAGGLPISVVDGIFSISLGSTVPIPESVFTGGGERWLEVVIDPGAPTEEILAPRQRIAAGAYAVKAGNATTAISANSAGTAASATMATDSLALGGMAAAEWQQSLVAPCASGEFLEGFAADGTADCAAPMFVPSPPLVLAASVPGPVLSVSNSSGGAIVAAARSGIAVEARADDSGAVPIVAIGASEQAANLQEWRDASGGVLASLDAAGTFFGDGSGLTGVHAATVADGIYATGSYANPDWITSLAGGKIVGVVASATDAATLGGVAATSYQRALTPTTCSAGQFLAGIAPGGAATCSPVSAPLALTAASIGAVLSASNDGTGTGVVAHSASGTAIHATGTGRIRSDADTVVTLAPFAMVSSSSAVQFLPSGAGPVTVYATSPGGYHVLIPVTWPASLHGVAYKLASIRICYKVNGGGSFITNTQVSVANESLAWGDILISSSTDRTSTTPTCYTVTDPSPGSTADAPFIDLQVDIGAAGVGNGIEIGKIALTLTQL